MTFRRLIAAAAIFLLAVFWKMTLPGFGDIVPALKEMLEADQVCLVLPEGVTTWLIWD